MNLAPAYPDSIEITDPATGVIDLFFRSSVNNTFQYMRIVPDYILHKRYIYGDVPATYGWFDITPPSTAEGQAAFSEGYRTTRAGTFNTIQIALSNGTPDTVTGIIINEVNILAAPVVLPGDDQFYPVNLIDTVFEVPVNSAIKVTTANDTFYTIKFF